jgi:CubicO group peptidase (beta-lactamase class C family)
MLRILCFLATALCLSGAADPERISRVESGLRSGTRIAGEPDVLWTIHQRMARHKVPSVSIAVISDGKVEWAKAYGVLDAATKLPANPETLFQAASISKPVSALAALRLVAQGKLTLDAPVNSALTSWSVPPHAFSKPVTLRGLLTHTAGTTVHGFPGYKAGAALPNAVQVVVGEMPANTSKVIVDLEPGSRWRYSGGGYTIMQILMTDVSKRPYAPLLRELVLGPLNMTRSTFEQPLPERFAANAARAHDRDGNPIAGNWHTYPEQAAAGLWTTPSDLAKVLLAVQRASAGDTRLLPAALTREMLTTGKGSYGLGWSLTGKDNDMAFSHGGANAGFRCMAWAYAAKGQGAVVMTNGDNGADLAAEVLRSIAAEYNWPDYRVQTRTPMQMSAQQLSAFAGAYTSAGGDVTVTVVGKGIKVQTPGPTAEFLPESETTFFPITDGAPSLVFEKNAEGKITGFKAGNMTLTRKE